MDSEVVKQANAYTNYFEAGQKGAGGIPVFQGAGAMPVFRGGGMPIQGGVGHCFPQSGAGIGDFFRGLFRRLLPIAIKGAATFIGETHRGTTEKGLSLGQAAKAALKPTAGDVLSGAFDAFAQRGSGKRRRRKRVYKQRMLMVRSKRQAKSKKKGKRRGINSTEEEAVHYNF